MRNNRLERIAYILYLLQNGGRFTFLELQEKIEAKFNKKLMSRQLRKDFKYLREVGINNIPVNIKVKNLKYYLSNEFTFRTENLNQTEKATLPFLMGILKPYVQIPAVSALLDNLISEHKIQTTEIKQMSVAFQSSKSIQDEINLQKVSLILECIYLQQAIEFNYIKVGEGVKKLERNENVSYRKVFPMQVRVFQNRYFLVGIQIDRKPTVDSVQTFAIDRMINGPNPYIPEDELIPLKFNWAEFFKLAEIKDYFKNSIGIIRNHLIDKEPVFVERWFSGSAASAIVAVPLHHSQEVLQKRADGSIRVRWFVYDNDELKEVLSIYGAACWIE